MKKARKNRKTEKEKSRTKCETDTADIKQNRIKKETVQIYLRIYKTSCCNRSISDNLRRPTDTDTFGRSVNAQKSRDKQQQQQQQQREINEWM